MQHKGVQALLIKYAIPEFAAMDPKDIIPLLDHGEEGAFLSGITTEIILPQFANTAILDVLFKVALPKEANGKGQKASSIIKQTEIQLSYNSQEYLLDRAIFYVSLLIAYQKDRTFKGSEYGKLQRVYSTWIVFSDAKKQDKSSHDCFQLMGEDQNWESFTLPLNSRLMNFEFYYIRAKPNGEYTGSIVEQMLYTLFMSNWEKADIIKRLRELGVVNAEALGDEVNMCKDLYKFYIGVGKEEGIEEGIGIGKEKGIEEGIGIGREKERIEQKRQVGRYVYLKKRIQQYVDEHRLDWNTALVKVLTPEEKKEFLFLDDYWAPVLEGNL